MPAFPELHRRVIVFHRSGTVCQKDLFILSRMKRLSRNRLAVPLRSDQAAKNVIPFQTKMGATGLRSEAKQRPHTGWWAAGLGAGNGQWPRHLQQLPRWPRLPRHRVCPRVCPWGFLSAAAKSIDCLPQYPELLADPSSAFRVAQAVRRHLLVFGTGTTFRFCFIFLCTSLVSCYKAEITFLNHVFLPFRCKS